MRNQITWDRPSKSLTSTPAIRRLVVRGYLPIGTSAMEANLSIMELRGYFDDESCLAGRQELLKGKTAMLMGFTDISGIVRRGAHLNEVVFLSPKRALINTSTPAAAWNDLLTQDMRSQPASCIKTILWRRL